MRAIFDDVHDEFRRSFSSWVAKEIAPDYMLWEEAGIARMDARWQGVARAPLEYGVPPPHSFPFQEWARLDDALTALANDCPAMTTLRQAGSFLGVFLTDGKIGRAHV